MRHINIIFLFGMLLFNCVHSCYFRNNLKRFDCDSPMVLYLQGTADWKYVLLYSHSTKFHLRNNTFNSTPNLEKLALRDIVGFNQGTFNGLTKLDRLVIFQNDLEEIPLGILDDLPIQFLQIYSTKIKRLYSGFFKNLPDLKVADLRFNRLKEIKAGIFNGSSIHELYLDGNELTSIENLAFSNMEFMTNLSLSDNNLTTFNAKLLLGPTSNLTHLWLDKNLLTKITKNMFETLGKLEKLFLEINQIDKIEYGAFIHLPKLDFLDISNNKLKELQPKIFPGYGMNYLYYFFIHNNHLTFINNALFVKTPRLHYLSIGGNPFQCSCLYEIEEWLENHNITRVCDDVYIAGQRPVCVLTDDSDQNKCIYDVNLHDNLYHKYTEALKEYPELKRKCDTTGGISNATLS